VSRRVLVTGGSRGIGRAIALHAARLGFDVVLTYHANPAAAEEACRLFAATGRPGRSLCFDVANREECDRILAADLAQHGPYWGVVCNAGTHADAPFPALSGDAWDRVIRTSTGSTTCSGL
jgi:3-oxoacyl-[acyl-carrier protein] reductase